MRCTLQDEFLPAQDVKDIKEGKVRNKTEEVVAVWDLEKEAWRSFRLDSITAVKVA
jgi:predicted DNA-binding transcriptional regulator YafY